MKKIDFSRLHIQYDIEGDKRVMDARKSVGNTVYRSNDVALSDFGKKIYYSEGEVEVPEDLLHGFFNLMWTSDLIVPVKAAIRDLITNQQMDEYKGEGNTD